MSRVGKTLKISWLDAWQNNNDYVSLEDSKAFKGKIIDSYGLCIADTKDSLVIAMDDFRPHNDDRFRDFKIIPQTIVIKVKELR